MLHDTKIVGIVNITPDSFSDGGQSFDPANAIALIEQLVSEGADVIDIGAESTRPGATPVTAGEEWARLEPVLKRLPPLPIPISIDTRHAQTAANALRYNVGWINDVSGFSSPEMIEAVKASDCKLVVMHSISVPADKNIVMPLAADVIPELLNFARKRFQSLEQAGIDRLRLLFDPGVGFGKTAQQSLAIIQGVRHFRTLGVPVLIGHSRKSFLPVRSDSPAVRDDATLAMSQYLAGQGVDYLRVHNVVRHKRLLSSTQDLLAHA